MRTTGKDARRVTEGIDRIVPAAVRRILASLLPTGARELIRSVTRSPLMRWLDDLLEQQSDRRYQVGKRVTSSTEVRLALSELPLPDGSIVLIHSAMSKLGFIEGGATTIVEALCDVIVKGRNSTVAMPTFTMIGGMADTLRVGTVFDIVNTPSGTGRITEVFRKRLGARRSLHPTHSVAAIGPRASWLVDGHHLDVFAFGPCSPFGRLLEADGFILGLGVDLGPVTFYHVVEDLGVFPRTVYTSDSPIPAVCLNQDGERVELKVMAHDPCASTTRIDKPNGIAIRTYITNVFEYSAGLTWHKIGDGRMWMAPARRIYECLDRLKEFGITIYAPENEVNALPHAQSILTIAR
jgi:aminoglycoside N3'-acetyltransferase